MQPRVRALNTRDLNQSLRPTGQRLLGFLLGLERLLDLSLRGGGCMAAILLLITDSLAKETVI